MMSGKELIIATKQYAKENRLKSWYYTFSTFFCLFSSYAIAINPSWFFGSFAPAHFSFYFLVQLFFGTLSGLLLARAFIIYHDYLHNSILQNSWLAKILFTFFGYHMLAPISVWKRSHDHHHNHNSKLYSSSIGSFPIVTKTKYLEASKKDRFIYLFIRHPLTILAGYWFSFAYGMCIRTLLRSPLKHYDAFFGLLFHYGCMFSVFYFFGVQSGLLGFLLPSLIAGAMGSYLFYAQHNFPGVVFQESEKWNYYDAALKSSSFMKLNPIMNWFTGNIGYHHIHHTNAKIPFYNLPIVYKNVKEFQIENHTTLSPKSILACLKLKVWDQEKNRMIGTKEIYA